MKMIPFGKSLEMSISLHFASYINSYVHNHPFSNSGASRQPLDQEKNLGRPSVDLFKVLDLDNSYKKKKLNKGLSM